ncbi:MAG: DUF1189 family protein [Opitutales bacterium]|nr:DUF1189 family protein [Opitutales bacterium]
MISFFRKSFGDASAYAAALKWGFFKTAAYVLTLCVVLSAILSAAEIFRFRKFMSAHAESICGQIPNAAISKDGLKLEGGAVKLVKINGSEDPIIGFTEDFFDAEALQKMIMAFEKNRITISAPNGDFPIFYDEIIKAAEDFQKTGGVKIAENGEIKISPGLARKACRLAAAWAPASIAAKNFFIIFGSAITTVLMLAITAYILSLTRLPSLGFGAFKIAALASTPVLVFQSAELLMFGGVSGMLFYAFAAFYIIWKVENSLAKNSPDGEADR